jgi:putative nucleotidyltransferase with HDIG domain
MGSRKSISRREQIRKDRPDSVGRQWERLRAGGVVASLGIAVGFFLVASAILMLREQVVPYRPGQSVQHDIVSRVNFSFMDKRKLLEAQREAKAAEPDVYTRVGDDFKSLEEKLLALPDRAAAAASLDELPKELKNALDSGSFTRLREFHSEKLRPSYNKWVHAYVAALRTFDPSKPETALYILSDDERRNEVVAGNEIAIQTATAGGAVVSSRIKAELTYSPSMRDDLEKRLARYADANFELALQPKIVAVTLNGIQPTYALNPSATTEARNRAESMVPLAQGQVDYKKNDVLVPRGEIDDRSWQLLRSENEAFVRSLDENLWKPRIGLVGIVALITAVLAAYIAKYQPRVIRKHPRAIAIAGLLVAMLLLAQVASIGSSPLFVFAIAPTILVAMILGIAYDQRFAMGVAGMHALLVTVAVGQGLTFFLILIAGVMTTCYLLDDIRTRSKLIEVGGVAAIAMMLATAAAGLINMDPLPFIAKNCLYTGAAGLAVGFVVLGILPFIEKAFRITTSMKLLELADASHPLLRRLSVEAQGTYNHSLQVATISEAAAESIGVNSLLCRVASYYHDVGKINKAEYFCENQTDGTNRHLNLSPSVSLLIIIGHVKDGIELAREYDLPTSIFPFIQQHHGTTLVEFFYHQASTQRDANQPAISETQYRYPGPKPRNKESAIVMIADAVESATRAMPEPNANRIESLVHDIVMKRLLDGQFEECDLTMREIQLVERSCVKSLLGIYHGRIAYPSSQSLPSTALPGAGAVRTA